MALHALERHLGAKLVETHARGCRPTAVGTKLAKKAASLVVEVDSLGRSFWGTRPPEGVRLVVGATARTLVDDLPSSIIEFARCWPDVSLALEELKGEEIPQAVETGRVDLGLAHANGTVPRNSQVIFEPAYELDVVLITPRDHPLAKRRRVKARDLSDYPLVNARPGLLDPHVGISPEKFGTLRAGPLRVETSSAVGVRRYVELGFGIGLIARRPSQESSPHVHERSMRQEFGVLTMYLVRNHRAIQLPHVRAFADLAKGRGMS